MIHLDELLNNLLQFQKSNNENPLVKSIEMDSRQVKDGSLFICIKGYTVDGHDFVDSAIEKGAIAILAERPLTNVTSVPVIVVNDTKRAMAIISNVFYDHPTKKMELIGVTGTNGKTTVTHLIEKILNDYHKKTGLIGTMYTKIGSEQFDVENTTPESLVLQQYFKKMVDENVNTAIMEVSSHALHLGRVRGCDFNIAVFTNLTQDHLDYHETMEKYLYAKGLLFAQLGNTYDLNSKKVAILNVDDQASLEYEKMTTAQVVTYGIEKDCDVRATNIKVTAEGTNFTLNAFGEEILISLQLIGNFSVYNALAATAAALMADVPLGVIARSLQEVSGVAGRFEKVDTEHQLAVIVDYAHTPDSLENVLQTIKEFAKGNIYVVVGCGGDRDRKKRPLMAGIASNYGDFVILTSDNPRSEDPKAIIKDMEEGLTDNSTNISIIDRKEAIYYAIKQAKEEDVILIAGKGHETYQTIGKENFFFDDRLVAKQALKELRD